jgi:hypothetical protein
MTRLMATQKGRDARQELEKLARDQGMIKEI